MAAVGIIAALVGAGNIAAGASFSAAAKDKINELNRKATQLKGDVIAAGNLYDNTYFPVAVSFQRVKKDLDQLPSDLLTKVSSNIAVNNTTPEDVKAIHALFNLLTIVPSQSSPSAHPGGGPIPHTRGGGGGVKPKWRPAQTAEDAMSEIGEATSLLRARSESDSVSHSDSFEDVPLTESLPSSPPEVSSLPETTGTSTLSKGITVANAVFGLGSLATIIGLGVWTVEKLESAISDVDTKQKQVTAFLTDMKKVLDQLVKAANIDAGTNYSNLIHMAATWNSIAKNCESYHKSLYYAIRGYSMPNPTLAGVKTLVTDHSDPGMPFPDSAYPLTQTLANKIKSLITEKKTDQEIVTYFAKTYPTVGLRCLFSEYFISTLRSI